MTEAEKALSLLAFHWYIDPKLPPMEIAEKILAITGKSLAAAIDQERILKNDYRR